MLLGHGDIFCRYVDVGDISINTFPHHRKRPRNLLRHIPIPYDDMETKLKLAAVIPTP